MGWLSWTPPRWMNESLGRVFDFGMVLGSAWMLYWGGVDMYVAGGVAGFAMYLKIERKL